MMGNKNVCLKYKQLNLYSGSQDLDILPQFGPTTKTVIFIPSYPNKNEFKGKISYFYHTI